MSRVHGRRKLTPARLAAIQAEMLERLVAIAKAVTLSELERLSPEILGHTLYLRDFVPGNAREAALVYSLRNRSVWFELLRRRVPENLRHMHEISDSEEQITNARGE